ncbi:hypothetical protein [Colwellia sp. C1TZA3]|uniref:hypothetical protein n=1 Tax=Colwellia sp. C1TZA3 TaxID=2508879 RepID=UPI0011BA170F|nr:hypothetical protein [Colwellia sp. C1TZA3]TWX73995.1 hypothetical protein ESZ39_01300 [Colwellia sp. C1TZA3]
MNNVSPIRKGLFQLLYSVIEIGVCRVITSKSSKLLASLKKTYIENIPEHHQVVFLPGKIEHLDDLTCVLVTAGIAQFSSIENNEQFLENAKQYLIENKDKEVITIWAFENADLISSDIHYLLGQLLAWQRYGSSLLTIELWGHTLLEKSYSSGEISQYYQSKIYPINLDENLNLKSKIALFNFKSINFKLFIALIGGLLLGPQIKPLLENFSNIYNSSAQPTVNLVSNIEIDKLTPKAIVAEPAFDDVDDNNSQKEILKQSNFLTLNEGIEFKENRQNLAITLASNTDETNNISEKNNDKMHNKQVVEHIVKADPPHWYFKLSPSDWLSEYNINLNHQLQTENNQIYIQYGVYRHKRSVIRFATENKLLSDYYHLCYSSDWQMVALMTGAYQGYRQAFKDLIKIKEQGFDGVIVNSSYLNAWQCSNQN